MFLAAVPASTTCGHREKIGSTRAQPALNGLAGFFELLDVLLRVGDAARHGLRALGDGAGVQMIHRFRDIITRFPHRRTAR